MPETSTKTKVIFTIGPATSEIPVLVDLINSGVDICRINMAHADHDWTRNIVKNIREAETLAGRQIALLMDVKGPEIRTGDVPEPVELEVGQTVTLIANLKMGTLSGDNALEVGVNYAELWKDLKVGDTVLVDSGLIRLEVIAITEGRIETNVIIAGQLGNRRHINLPGVRVNLPALTEKDRADVRAGVANGMDFFALSFVREASDVIVLRDYLKSLGSTAKIISKIEDQQAISNLDAIVQVTDALMIARGDLGIEVPFEDLPVIQNRAIEACIHHSKPVIVATHMLESMTNSPVPTRAEVTDVSYAVREQADCVMLSGETTVGKYPVACVATLKRIATRMESEEVEPVKHGMLLKLPKSRLMRSSAYLAAEMEAPLVVFTQRGFYTQKLSSLRPKMPVYAFTDNPVLFRHLLIMRGIEPFLIEFNDEDPESTIQSAFEILKEKRWCLAGTQAVVITKVRSASEIFHSTQLRTIA